MNNKLIGKCIEALVVAAVAGVLIAGCGGGGGSGSGSPSNFTPTATMCCGGSGGGGTAGTSSSGTPVASYIADSQGTSFVGIWTNWNFTGSPQSATAATSTLAAAGTLGTYNITESGKVLANGVWSTSSLTAYASNLTAAGWVKQSVTGNTFIDSGDGIHASKNTSGAIVQYSMGVSSLGGTTVKCTDVYGAAVTCTGPSTYAAGASRYTLTYASTFYAILGSPLVSTSVTDGSGVALAALPVIGTTTFCDSYWGMVYQPIAGATGTAPNYNVFYTLGCSATAITTALAGTAAGTVLATATATNNSVVPTVLTLSGWTGSLTVLNIANDTLMYGLNGGQVWPGDMVTPGYVDTVENKIAINSELVANGFVAIP